MKVLVLNHYAANKGDRAVLHFVTRELARNGVESIAVSAHDRRFWPDGLRAADRDIPLVPWGWNEESRPGDNLLRRAINRLTRAARRRIQFPLVRNMLLGRLPMWLRPLAGDREFIRALLDCDAVVSTGGHHIQTRFTREAICAQTHDMALAQLFHKPLAIWSQTVGPLDFKAEPNRAFIRRILDQADVIYLRDEESAAQLRSCGASQHRVYSTYDSVIGLNDEAACFVPAAEKEPIIGVSVYSAEQRGRDEYARYVKSMAASIDMAAAAGHRVRFFPMEMDGAAADDRPCIRDILAQCSNRHSCSVEERDLDTQRHMRQVAECRLFIGHKTHSQIFALTAGTPLLALAYHQKTLDFMAQYGLAENCICDASLDAPRLNCLLLRMLTKLDSIGRRQFEQSRIFGRQVRSDFGHMLMLLGRRSGQSREQERLAA